MKKRYTFLFLSVLLPVGVHAASDIQGLLRLISDIIRQLSAIAMGLAFLFFLWGIVRFILATGSGEEKEKAKGIMLWGVIALFIMFSIWGIVNFLQESFLKGSTLGGPDEIPTTNPTNNGGSSNGGGTFLGF